MSITVAANNYVVPGESTPNGYIEGFVAREERDADAATVWFKRAVVSVEISTDADASLDRLREVVDSMPGSRFQAAYVNPDDNLVYIDVIGWSTDITPEEIHQAMAVKFK